MGDNPRVPKRARFMESTSTYRPQGLLCLRHTGQFHNFGIGCRLIQDVLRAIALEDINLLPFLTLLNFHYFPFIGDMGLQSQGQIVA